MPHRYAPLWLGLFVVALMQIAARLLAPTLGVWAWAPLHVLYWSVATALALRGSGRAALKRWIGPSANRGAWPAIVLAISVVPALPLLFPNVRLLLRTDVWVSTLVFSLCNPVAEELFWRGHLLEALTARGARPAGAAIASSVLFTVNHQWIAVTVASARNPAAIVFQSVFALVLSATFLRTRSLRWPLLGHALTNLLSITPALFLSLYVPGR